MSVYVVAGVTGHVGSVAADEMLAGGAQVRVIVRDGNRGAAWRERGAEIAAGSLRDVDFLKHALAGAAALFTLLPPDNTAGDFYGGQRQTADAIASAVRQSGAPYVVLLSSLGADLAEGNGPIKGLHYMEKALRATGVKLVAIRASYFQENAASALPAARGAGVFANFLPSADMAIPMVATEDIGRLAASLLKSPPPASEVVDLLGPRYSMRQLSDKIGAALGRRLEIVDIPPAERVDAFTQAGLPEPVAKVYAELYEALGAGLITSRGGRVVTGATTFEQVLPRLLASADAGAGRLR